MGSNKPSPPKPRKRAPRAKKAASAASRETAADPAAATADDEPATERPSPPQLARPGKGNSSVRASRTEPASVPPPRPIAPELPTSRYEIVGAPAGVVCSESPNVRLVVERGLTVTEEARGRYPEQSIFLDGVFGGAPFLDNKARQYSLDHHAGCPRPLMLATCEQATVMVAQGLPLDDGPWHLFINEPDLDAVLGAWVLLNHRALLKDDQRLLRRAMPLIRVQGLIDAHGLEMDALAALPRRFYEAQKSRIYELRGVEIRLKADGDWETMDPLRYAHDLLVRIDHELLGPGALRGAKPAPRYDEVQLPARKLAVLCISTEGIYEVETQLRQRYHDELGVIVLDRGKGRMTLRQVDPFLPTTLSDLYPVLNERDPNVSDESDNRWGGSDDIGGSPRRTGTGLSGPDVLHIASEFFTGDGGR